MSQHDRSDAGSTNGSGGGPGSGARVGLVGPAGGECPRRAGIVCRARANDVMNSGVTRVDRWSMFCNGTKSVDYKALGGGVRVAALQVTHEAFLIKRGLLLRWQGLDEGVRVPCGDDGAARTRCPGPFPHGRVRQRRLREPLSTYVVEACRARGA